MLIGRRVVVVVCVLLLVVLSAVVLVDVAAEEVKKGEWKRWRGRIEGILQQEEGQEEVEVIREKEGQKEEAAAADGPNSKISGDISPSTRDDGTLEVKGQSLDSVSIPSKVPAGASENDGKGLAPYSAPSEPSPVQERAREGDDSGVTSRVGGHDKNEKETEDGNLPSQTDGQSHTSQDTQNRLQPTSDEDSPSVDDSKGLTPEANGDTPSDKNNADQPLDSPATSADGNNNNGGGGHVTGEKTGKEEESEKGGTTLTSSVTSTTAQGGVESTDTSFVHVPPAFFFIIQLLSALMCVCVCTGVK